MVNYYENVNVRRGTTGRSHIPAMPLWIGIIRIFQMVLTFIVLVLTAYAASVFGTYAFPGYGMSFFTFIWTAFFLAYIIVAALFFPHIYNSWAHLVLETLTNIFWLTTWALLAEHSRRWEGWYWGGWNYNGRYNGSNSAVNCTRAAAALGAINWALFCITLGFFVFYLHRLRKSNSILPS